MIENETSARHSMSQRKSHNHSDFADIPDRIRVHPRESAAYLFCEKQS
jgi:hypothetical protein